jgi:2,3-bisphosphoglycerate-dependent phosphoglycerate mutase
MSNELIRLRRRPLLAPLLIPMLGLLAAGAGIYWIGTWARTTVVILVRHAEAGTSATGDPDLSPAGEKRVAGLGELLADLLEPAKVDYLYAADTRRALQTAAPIANQFKLPVNLLASSDWTGIAGRIKREHRGKTVVVVGYATTLPTVLSQLSGSAVAMAEDEFDSIYVVVMPSPGETRVFRLRYGERPAARVVGGAK